MERKTSTNENISPVIGILCIDISMKIRAKFGDEYKSYIAASYVKYLECSGARVISIWMGKDENYYREILSIINGVLIPGGAMWFNDPELGRAAYSAKTIYKIACEINKSGIYLPIWGTCLGFQLLIYAASGGNKESREEMDKLMNESLPIIVKKDFRQSKIFRNVPDDIIEILKNEPVTYNFHKFCITKKILDNLNLVNDWRLVTTNEIMCTNEDTKTFEFISTIEHKNFPFYGVQFHPEKSQFEFYPNDKISHTKNAIKVSQYFSNFFIEECRKNENFINFDENLNKFKLIYNFPITFTGLHLQEWRQCYLFEEDIDYPENNLI